jgi:hypothetical protein
MLATPEIESDFEHHRIERAIANLERQDDRRRRQFTIQCELHMRDLRKHHRPLGSISKEAAATVRRKSGTA